MDVRMPDGTIIRNVPEGTTKEQLQQKLALRRLKAENPGEYDPLSPEFQAKYGATSGNSFLQNTAAGIGQGVVNAARKVGNLVGAVSDEDYARAKALDAPLMNTGGGKVGSFLGETALVSLPTMGFGLGVQAAGRAAQGVNRLATAGKVIANPVFRGAAEGAAQGAVLADPNERGIGAAIGGMLGGAIPGAAAGVRKLSQGLKRTPEAQLLLDQGVSLTPGQMNPRGMLNQAEEALQSAPFIGAPIKNARDNAMLDYNRAAINRTVAPGQPQVTAQTLSGMMDQVDQGFDAAYSAFKGFPITPPTPLSRETGAAIMDKGIFADDAARKAVKNFVDNKLTALGDSFTSGDLLRVRSEIRAMQRDAVTSQKTEVANLFSAAERKLTKLLESQIPQDAVKALRATDAQYRRLSVVTKAAAKANDRATFTPNMHSQAIKQSVSDKLFARGGGDGRDLARAAREVFDVRMPPTGARLGVLGLGAAGLYSNPYVAAPMLSSVYGLAATETGRKIAAGQTMTQAQIRALIKRIEQDARAAAVNQAAQRGLVTAGTKE